LCNHFDKYLFAGSRKWPRVSTLNFLPDTILNKREIDFLSWPIIEGRPRHLPCPIDSTIPKKLLIRERRFVPVLRL
jgi:hypothetical protein